MTLGRVISSINNFNDLFDDFFIIFEIINKEILKNLYDYLKYDFDVLPCSR